MAAGRVGVGAQSLKGILGIGAPSSPWQQQRVPSPTRPFMKSKVLSPVLSSGLVERLPRPSVAGSLGVVRGLPIWKADFLPLLLLLLSGPEVSELAGEPEERGLQQWPLAKVWLRVGGP